MTTKEKNALVKALKNLKDAYPSTYWGLRWFANRESTNQWGIEVWKDPPNRTTFHTADAVIRIALELNLLSYASYSPVSINKNEISKESCVHVRII